MLYHSQWGFIGNTAGANIQFKVDTTAEAMKEKNLTSISIVYLKSYEHMGKAGACLFLLQ